MQHFQLSFNPKDSLFVKNMKPKFLNFLCLSSEHEAAGERRHCYNTVIVRRVTCDGLTLSSDHTQCQNSVSVPVTLSGTGGHLEKRLSK